MGSLSPGICWQWTVFRFWWKWWSRIALVYRQSPRQPRETHFSICPTYPFLAFSPDNNQVFSSGRSAVFIYDITTQVLNFVCFHDDVIINHILKIIPKKSEKQVSKINFNEHRGGSVESISFYPESNGDVFVTTGGGSLAILDKRTGSNYITAIIIENIFINNPI